MIFIRDISAVTTLSSFEDLKELSCPTSKENKLFAGEMSFDGIPLPVLRRMGKAVRLCVGAALPLLRKHSPQAIIVGTANGGMEDSIKFMNQIMQYEEDTLAPGNFVQSTPNGLASQTAFLTRNRGYNNTHVHRGLSFENALLDVMLLAAENNDWLLLAGGADEISSYNYNIDHLAGWYKKDETQNNELYESKTLGTIAGEGAAMFILSNDPSASIASIDNVCTFHSGDLTEVETFIRNFFSEVCKPDSVDLVISGENGDTRFEPFYLKMEKILSHASVLRYKHLTGEFPTSTAMATWLATKILREQQIPEVMIKQERAPGIRRILIYNAYQGYQHSLIQLTVTTDSGKTGK
jgi:hypothetical protein